MKELVDSYKQAKKIIKKIEDKIDLSKGAEEVLERIDEITEKYEKVDLLKLYDEISDSNKLISGLIELAKKGIVDVPIRR